MIKHQKKHLLVSINSLFIRREATEDHNELTLVKVVYAIPLRNLFSEDSLNMGVVEGVLKLMKEFKDINFKLDHHKAAFIFTIKARTERRKDDVHNQELADKIVMAKANVKAAKILKTIIVGNNKVKGLVHYHAKAIDNLTTIGERLCNFIDRETSYIEKV